LKLLTNDEYTRLITAAKTIEGGGSGGLSVFKGRGIAGTSAELLPRRGGVKVSRLIWVKITGNETGGGKYTGKSYTHDGTTDVAGTGNLAESELGTLASTVDCRIVNYAEVGAATHDLEAGDVVLCHWYRTNSDGIKVCSVNAGEGVQDFRYNTSIHNLQATYARSPVEADWANRVQFDPCNTTPTFTRVGSTGFTGVSRVLREITSVSAGEGPTLVESRRRFTGKASGRYDI
jgi:hypothetical protein